MPHFSSDGVSIYYELHGDGEPVVLIHGFASSFTRNWVETGWVSFLETRGFQVIGLDVRGHGKSAKLYDPSAYRTPALAGDVLHLLDHLRIPAANLIGFSMGGAIALTLGMEDPRRIRKIVVGGVGDAVFREAHDPRQIAEIAAALGAPDLESVPGERGRLFRSFAERGRNDLRALAALMHGPGWPGDLEHSQPIDRPLLFVVAEKDEIMSGTERLARAFPDARWVFIPDRNHNSVVGDPRFKEAALTFLAAG